ncbi:RPM1-interacting protein 4 [Rutidosis leptorrhynchoides]|uniref:RPM1-interacting protein 4 n=1 Tax=Rutidosis leptorrhynchoides TaxID=125765 RepID=UPI003A998627
MARPTVPKFGNWESEDNVPYTVYFEKARKGKTGGKMINPNDPQENPEMFADIKTPPRAAPVPKSRPYTEPEEPVRRQTVRPSHDRRVSREESEYAPSNDNTGRRTSGSAHQRGGQGAGTGRQGRNSMGSDHSFDKSPLHPHYQGRVTPKGSASPAWEGKNSYDSSHGTPGRSRMKPAQSPDRGAAVPRFGEWDNNPSSAENYTHIFNKVREERATGSPMVSGSDARPNYNNQRNQEPKSKCFCFPW